MKNFILAIIVAVTVSACGGGMTEIRRISDQPRKVVDKNYLLGQEQVAHVGEPIIFVDSYSGWPLQSFSSDRAFEVSSSDHGKVQYAAGTEATAAWVVSYGGKIYFAADIDPPLPDGAHLLIDDNGRYHGTAIAWDPFPTSRSQTDWDQDEWADWARDEFRKTRWIEEEMDISMLCEDPGDLCVTPASIHFSRSSAKRLTDKRPTPDSIKFELVYSGSTENTITLMYREYTSTSIARPAFTQNLVYDRETPAIRFRGFLIRVLTADNASMRYIVEKDDLPAGDQM